MTSRPPRVTPSRASRHDTHPNRDGPRRALLRCRVATIAAGAPVVLLADILEESELVPIGPQRQLEVLRERPREDLGVVDSDLVLQLVARAPQSFDRMQRIGVPAALRGIGVVVI